MKDKLTTQGLVVFFCRLLFHRDFFRGRVFRECLKFFRAYEQLARNEVPSVELLDAAILELEKHCEAAEARRKSAKSSSARAIYSQDHESLETLIQLLWELHDKQLPQHQTAG